MRGLVGGREAVNFGEAIEKWYMSASVQGGGGGGGGT